MRITPLDIRKQEFRKTMRGLDGDEVYAFLGTVADEYEAVLSDNKRLREHVVQLEERLNEFKTMETNLRNTLLTAERITADAKDNARREADLIIRGAEVEAEKATEMIRAHTQQLRREILELKKHKDNYITRLRTLLESHMRVIEGFAEDFAETDREIEAIGRKVEEDTKTAAPAPRMSRERITEDLPPREPVDKVTWGGDEHREDAPRPTVPPPAREGSADDAGKARAPERDEQASAPKSGAPSAAAPELDLPLEQPSETARRVVTQGYSERLQTNQAPAGTAVMQEPAGEAPPQSPLTQTDQWKSYEVNQAKPDWKSYEVPRSTAAPRSMEAPRQEAAGKVASPTAVEEPSDSEVENALSGLTEFGLRPSAEAKPAMVKPAQAAPVQKPPQAPKQVLPQVPAAAQQPAPPAGQEPRPAAAAPRPAAQQQEPVPADAPGKIDDAAGWTMEELRKNLTNIDRET